MRYNRVHDVVGCVAYDKTDSLVGSVSGRRIRTPCYTFGIYFDNSPVGVQVSGNIVAGPTLASVASLTHW